MPLTTVSPGMLDTTAQYYSFKNRIINGAMSFWQRGTSFTNPTTSNFYTADRWAVNRTGDAAGATVSRSTDVPAGFQYSLKLQRTAGNTSTAGLFLFNSNESVNTLDLAGQVVTLSFWIKAGANYSGGAISLTARSGTGTDQRVYAYTGGAAFISTSQAITSTWTRYSFTGTVSASATEMGFQLSWTPTGTAGADDSVYITGVQLEKGSTATSFDYRPYGTELILCQRYYQKSYAIESPPGSATTLNMAGTSISGPSGAGNYIGTVYFVQTMRTTPTLSYWDGNGNASRVSYVPSAGSTTFTHNITPNTAPFNLGASGFLFYGSNSVANYSNFLHYAASSEL